MKTEYHVLGLVKFQSNRTRRGKESGEGREVMGRNVKKQGKTHSFPQDTLLVLQIATEQLACGLLGSNTTARVWQHGYSLQTTATSSTDDRGSVRSRRGQAAELVPCHVFTMLLSGSGVLSPRLLQSLAFSDSHEYSENTNTDRWMPLWSSRSLTRELSGRHGNTIVWSWYNDSRSSAIHCTRKKKKEKKKKVTTQRVPKVKTEPMNI